MGTKDRNVDETGSLPSLSDQEQILVAAVPDPEAPVWRSPFVLMRVPNVFNVKDQHRLLECWAELQQHIHRPASRSEHRITSTPAIRFSLWELCGNGHFISANMAMEQPGAKPVFDRLRLIIKEDIAPTVSRLFEQFSPQEWQHVQRFVTCSFSLESLADTPHTSSAHTSLLAKNFRDESYIDFDGAFFTVTIQEPARGLLDSSRTSGDKHYGLSWVMPLGKWELRLPELNYKIPILPGQFVGALTDGLVHHSTPLSDQGVVLKFSVDRLLL